MKNLFKNKYTWIAIVAIIIIAFLVIRKKRSDTVKNIIEKKPVNPITGSNDSVFNNVIASLSPAEKSVWDKVNNYQFSDEDNKMMKDEASVELVLKNKVKLTDAEIDTFDKIVGKLMLAGATNIVNKK